MTESAPLTFDGVSVIHIERYWWDGDQSAALLKLLQHFLSPDDGNAWLRSADGTWIHVDQGTLDDAVGVLSQLTQVWASGSNRDHDYFKKLRTEGQCTVFLDSARMRTCVHPDAELPDSFCISFQVDWSFNSDAGGVILTPHLRITSGWPTFEVWAPPAPDTLTLPTYTAKEAAKLLEDGLWLQVGAAFRAVRDAMELNVAAMKLDDKPQLPPLFYYVSPTRRPEEAEEYLHGEYRRALDALGLPLLGTPDIRSTEVTAGVLEGCLAAFTHTVRVQWEYCLLLPLAGTEERRLEDRLHFVTYEWQDVDFDAAWEVFDITTDLEAEHQFFALWLGSLDTAMSLNEALFPLLRKPAIQDRMFALAQLLNGFLANLHARTYAGAKKRTQYKRNLEWTISNSKTWAEAKFTIRAIEGLELPRDITDGYTRSYVAFEERIGQAVDSAHALSAQIEDVTKSLSYTAGLEEQRRDRERRQRTEREEKADKRLNIVLALVAVLAAIPLIVGSFDNTALSQAIPWFPFGMGLYFSFWIALAAFVATVVAIVHTLRTGQDGANGEISPVEQADLHANALFDCYRSYEHSAFQDHVYEAVFSENADPATRKAAVQHIHDFDVRTARVVAAAVEHTARWEADDVVPASDEAWASSMEARVCRFVLLSDTFDLRPENLKLPVTLCFYRLKYGAAGLGSNPVSDWEFRLVMARFGFTEAERDELDAWGQSEEALAMAPSDFVDALVARGVSARRALGDVATV